MKFDQRQSIATKKKKESLSMPGISMTIILTYKQAHELIAGPITMRVCKSARMSLLIDAQSIRLENTEKRTGGPPSTMMYYIQVCDIAGVVNTQHMHSNTTTERGEGAHIVAERLCVVVGDARRYTARIPAIVVCALCGQQKHQHEGAA